MVAAKGFAARASRRAALQRRVAVWPLRAGVSEESIGVVLLSRDEDRGCPPHRPVCQPLPPRTCPQVWPPGSAWRRRGGKVSPRADLSSGSKESIAQPRHSHGDVRGQKHRQPVLEGTRRDRSPRACSTGRPLREVVWRSLKELRVGLQRDSAVPHLHVCPRELQTGRTLIHAHAASQQHRRPRHRRVEAARAPITGRWTDGLCSAHHGKLFSRNTE